MKKIITAALLMFAGSAALLAADKANPFYAQKLVDEFTGKYSDIFSIGLHGKPPGAADYQIIAHTNKEHVGEKSKEPDLAAMQTGKPEGPEESKKNPGVFDVVLPLYQADGKTIGAFVIKVKTPEKDAVQTAIKYRDLMAKEIPEEAKLFEPAN